MTLNFEMENRNNLKLILHGRFYVNVRKQGCRSFDDATRQSLVQTRDMYSSIQKGR